MVGVAEEDAAAGSQVTVRARGMWFSPIDATTCPLRAGNAIRANEGTTSAGVQRSGTTTRAADDNSLSFGVALTGSAVDDDYILWMGDFASRK